jgi:uncharacterized repeat protein (TIGR01451 family)
VVGVIVGSAWLVTMGALIAGVGAVSAVWVRLALKAVGYERALSAPRVFAGDTVTLTTRLRNDKLLPLAWLRLNDSVPDGLTFVGRTLGASSRPYRRSLYRVAALRPYDRLTWRDEVECPRRGIYNFGPATLEASDVFGLYRSETTRDAAERLVVYPAIQPLAALGFPPDALFGGRRASRPLERDPLRPMGARPWEPGDSRRMVDWPATARVGALQVKVVEPVSQETLMVVMNVATFEQAWIGVDPELQERVIQIAGSIAHHALASGLAVGLATNAGPTGTSRTVRVPPSSRPDAASDILEALAGITAFVALPADRLLVRESRHAPWGATMVVVTSIVDAALVAALLRLRRAGRRVALVSIDPAFRQTLPGVATYLLATASESVGSPSRPVFSGSWLSETTAAAGRGL